MIIKENKDPAFLFYSKDFYESTRMMLPEERACYIDLLIYQHQNGAIPTDLKRVLMYCNGVDEATLKATLQAKFKQTYKGWVNLRLQKEIDSRNKYKNEQSLSGKLGQFWKKTYNILSKKDIEWLKKNVSKDYITSAISEIDLTNESTLKELLKGLLETPLKGRLSIYEDENKDIYSIDNSNIDSNSLINTNTREKKITSKKFSIPSVQEIQEYCDERQNLVDADKFHSHYTSVGWKVGKNPMKDWKAAVRTWEKNSNNKANHNGTSQSEPQQERFAGRQSKQQVYDAIQRELTNPYDPRNRE